MSPGQCGALAALLAISSGSVTLGAQVQSVPAALIPAATSSAGPSERIDAFMSRAASYSQFNGAVLVIDRGRRIYERAFGKANMEWDIANTLDTRFEIASMTKPMTAILIMQLVEEGKVRLDGRVSEYLPFYPRETGDRITVRQLLDHTSGIQQDIAFADDPHNVPPIVAAVNADVFSNDSLVSMIARRPLRFEPGTSYGYSSDAYAVLGAIVQHVTGRPYWQVLRERVLDPARMTQTGVALLKDLVPRRAAGYAQTFDGYENAAHIGVSPAGGLYSTLRDLHRFDQALYGTSLVNEQSKELLFATRQVITAYGWKTTEDTLPSGSVRSVIRTTGGLPGFAALMVRIPSLQRTIILLANTRDLAWRFDDFAVAIGRILDGRPYAMPKRSAAEQIAVVLKQGGTPARLRSRFDAMRADTAHYVVSETEMNRLGYYFLESRRVPLDAIAILELNVAAFPKSANVYDSLGEAYAAHGDVREAVANYRRSLELDPGSTSAINALKRLGSPP